MGHRLFILTYHLVPKICNFVRRMLHGARLTVTGCPARSVGTLSSTRKWKLLLANRGLVAVSSTRTTQLFFGRKLKKCLMVNCTVFSGRGGRMR